MKIYKDHQHSVTLSPFNWQGQRYLMVSVGLYAALDPAGGTSTLRTEQDFWKEAPDAFAALGQMPVMDMNLPKPAAEVLVAGFARTPKKMPVSAMEVSFRVGATGQRLAVFGDRQRLSGGGVTEPIPFTAMPLVWERAFGGPDFPLNLAGRGLVKDNKPSEALPNIEDPAHLILSGNDMPDPVCPLPIDLANPVRRNLSGTYDQHWIDTRWPHYPNDCSPQFFHSAMPALRLAKVTPPYFQGNEEMEIMGMHHDFPHIRSRLPEVRIRAFILTTKEFVPFAPQAPKEGVQSPLPYAKDLEGPGIFQEVELRLDTVWLLPDLMGAYVLRRGLLPVVDDEMDDILRVFVVTEKPESVPQTLDYYFEELKKRAHPTVEIDIAPLAEAQAKNTKLVKKARDIPKLFAAVKKRALDQSPSAPLSLADMAFDAQKTLATGRATLDTVEKQVLALRDQFSHVMNFDLSVFPRLRATMDKQEHTLETTLREAAEEIARADTQIQQETATLRTKGAKLLTPPSDASPMEIADKANASKLLQAKLEKLDKFTVEGMLCEPPSIAPWHDRGFPMLLAARRALTRNDKLLARLHQWGLEQATLRDAWMGYAAEPVDDTPENWGLDPTLPAFTLPAGLYVPRFNGKELSALTVYPLNDAEKGEPHGLGEEAPLVVRVPESDDTPLRLPAAHPGGAVLVAPDDLSALFAEQEAGDFCHIVATQDPAALADIEGLPLLVLPEETTEQEETVQETPAPLCVLLPPLPAGKKEATAWLKEYPEVILLHLPEDCPHVLCLAERGHRLRRLLLDVLPPDLAKVHDFDFPLPPKDKPMQPFTLNLPLPTKEELQEQIYALIQDIRAHFPDPEVAVAQAKAEAKALFISKMREANMPAEAIAKAEAAFDAPVSVPEAPPTVAATLQRQKAALQKLKADALANLPKEATAEERNTILAKFAEAEEKMQIMDKELLPLDALRDEGMAKLAAFKKGELPPEITEKFAEKGMDPYMMRLLSREEVQTILAGDKNLSRRNMQGLDLSGLDFTGATLAHAMCGKANFTGSCMNGADFTFTLAQEADFTEATFHEATFKQTVLQKAVLAKADFSTAKMELTTLGECDCTGANFDRAVIKLCNFTKSTLERASFVQTMLSLSVFADGSAVGANFAEMRGFKCLFQKMELKEATFRKAVLNECLLMASNAAGVAFCEAELRKFYTEADTNLCDADFTGADMREASLRKSRLCNAEFHKVNLQNALIAQCDLTGARLDGLHAEGCRFTKCDLGRADLSGSSFYTGGFHKSRLTGADLGDTSLHCADLTGIVLDSQTNIEGTIFKRTILAGKEEALRYAARRDSGKN